MKNFHIISIHLVFIFNILFCYTASDAFGTHGMVVSSKNYANEIGIDILKNGGNAIDAAVAVGFALSVTHPSAGNIGGGGFMVIRFADGNSTTIDFRETAPSNSHRDMYLDENGNVISGKSWSTALGTGVPGTVAGLGYAHEKYGTLPWKNLLLPSIYLAKYGYILDNFDISLLNSQKYKEYLSRDDYTKNIFTKTLPFNNKELFVQEDLSNTLLRIAKYGYKEFYIGKTGQYILDCMRRTNGIINYNDLVNYKPVEREPIIFDYKGYNIITMPLPSSGGITLANILNQLEYINLDLLGFHSSEFIHYLVEAQKRAYLDRALYLGDSDFVDVPIEKLISEEHARNNFLSINPSKSTDSYELNPEYFSINNESEETTHYSIVDDFGNAVSVTYTLNGWYGNGITVDNAGFLLNNEMDDFSSKPGHANAYGLVGNEANSIQPNKRMLSSMTPTIVENLDDELYMVLGSPGGSTIITTVAQIIINVIDFKMNIDDAVESKRFHHQWLPPYIQAEQYTFPYDVVKNLQNYGHKISYRSSFGIGEANCIMIENNNYYGSADSRRGAYAKGY